MQLLSNMKNKPENRNYRERFKINLSLISRETEMLK
jgi:hypothetical protein